jgi:aryl-alcohol dehydrogenase-like predicted oxidoreductase
MDRSLKRLQTDHVDVYLLHAYPESSPLEETLRALDDLVTQGKTRYIGVCNFDAWQVMKALWTQDGLGADPLICVQNQYSLLNRGLESEMFGVAADQELGVMAYSPLAIGLLSGAYSADEPLPPHSPWESAKRGGRLASALTPQTVNVIESVRRIAFERGKTMSQVAINWLLSHPEVTVAISGSDTIEQLDDNLGALGWQLSENEINTLEALSAGVDQIEGL